MLWSRLCSLQFVKITRIWLVRPRATASVLYLFAVACVIGTMIMTFSQVINSHVTVSPPVIHRWSVHFLTENAMHGGNCTNNTEKNGTKIIWTHPELNILQKEPFQFLKSYKNPCWYEPLFTNNVYERNKYNLLSSNVRFTMIRLVTEWNKRLTNEQNPKRLRCLPYFFIIGQPKCGSTDLFKRIIQHPDVTSPPIKELHWWSRNRMGKRINYTDIIPLSDYVDMFDHAAMQIERRGDDSKHQIVTGEASVSVMWENDDWWHFPENEGLEEPFYTNPDYVKHLLPDLKIIVILRNPSERLFSDYLYFNPKANKSLEEFHDKVNFSIQLYDNCFRNHSIRHCIYNTTIAMTSQVRLRIGMYSAYLKDWLRVFPKEQILVITLKEYSDTVIKTMKKVFKFLNLRALSKEQYGDIKKMRRQNKRKYKDTKLGSMLEKTADLLNNFYSSFNDELKTILGQDFTWEGTTEQNKSVIRNAPIVSEDDL